MSLDTQVAQLRFEVEELRALVEVQGRLLRRLIGEQQRESEFDLISEASATPGIQQTPDTPAACPNPPVSVPAQSGAGSSRVHSSPSISQQEREEIARCVGHFLRRALRGDHTGTSHRDRNPLRSRVYVVCQDFAGHRIEPPRVLDRFSEAAALCKRGSDCGSSVFVGLPSRWEARLALQTAGLSTDGC